MLKDTAHTKVMKGQDISSSSYWILVFDFGHTKTHWCRLGRNGGGRCAVIFTKLGVGIRGMGKYRVSRKSKCTHTTKTRSFLV